MHPDRPRARGFLFPFLIALGAVFLLNLGWTAWRWYRFYQAFNDTNLPTASSAAPSTPSPKKPLPSLIDGITPPPGSLASINPLFLPPYMNDGIQETLPGDVAYFSKRALPDIRLGEPRVTALLQKLETGLASIPAVDLERQDFNLDRPAPDYREIRAASKYWYLVGRILGEEGHHREAIRVMLGIALLARVTEPLCPTDMPMLRRMIACSIRKTAGRGLIAVVRNGAALSPDEVAIYLRLIERLEQGMEFGELFVSEIRSLQEFGKTLAARADAGNTLALRKRPIAELLTDKGRMERFFQSMVAPIIEATKRPFPHGQAEYAAKAGLLENSLQEVTSDRLTRVARFLFTPETYYFEEIMYQTLPNSGKAFAVDVESRQFLRGAGAAIAVQAFRTSKGTWPQRLDEVASWTGVPLPKDLLTDAPLLWENSLKPRLWSPGKDLRPHTDDDLLFIIPESEVRR